VNLTYETEREVDGRWIAEIPELPGVMVYGATEGEALAKAEVLARLVIAEAARARHSGKGRNPSWPWTPAFAGVTGGGYNLPISSSSQLLPASVQASSRNSESSGMPRRYSAVRVLWAEAASPRASAQSSMV